jgi:hypothetical protein
VKSGKEQKHLVIAPLADPLYLEENGLKKEKEEGDPNYFTGDHHEEVWPIGHLPHQTNLDEKTKQLEISIESTHHSHPITK